MYVIDINTRNKIYSRGLSYTPIVKIGDTEIPYSEIKSIKIDDPIIDKTSETMYIGTFVAKKLEMEFRSALSVDFSEQVSYSIIINDNGVETTVPIGLFNIETSPTDYYKTYKLVALDNSVKFKNNIDISGYYTDIYDYSLTKDTTIVEGKTYYTRTGTEGSYIYIEVNTPIVEDIGTYYERTLIGKEITAEYMLQVICGLVGVAYNPLPAELVNTTVKTGYSDTSFSGKQYISYLAEIMGGFAKIDRTGKLSIIPAKSTPVVTINGLASKSFTVDELYRVTRVRWENGINLPSESALQENNGNTLYIRANNIFMQGTDSERQTIIDNLGANILGLAIQNLTTENYADFTLDSWDMVSYILGNITYTTFYDNSFEFKGSIMGKVDVKLPTKNQEETTNVIGDAVNVDTVRGIKTIIDQLQSQVQIVASDYKRLDETVTKLNSSMYYQDSTKFRFVLQEQIVQRENMNEPYTDSDGNVYDDVQYANQQGYTFDKEGLKIAKQNSGGDYIEDTRSLLNGKGMTITENKNDSTILYAGYNDRTGESVVDTQNTTVRHYLVLNDGDDDVGRFESYFYSDGTNSEYDNTTRVGFFWVYD